MTVTSFEAYPSTPLAKDVHETQAAAASSVGQGKNAPLVRPHVAGKFIYIGDEKFYVKGITYGAFRPDAEQREYHDTAQIEQDFAMMAANGFNTVRIPHTTPPCTLLDIAFRHNLRVMVGFSAEQYVGFLIDKKKAPNISRIVREKVGAVKGHPALLCYAIGNEIAGSVARWLGSKKVESYLRGIFDVVKKEDSEPDYVNYYRIPTPAIPRFCLF